ncbi:MAG: 1,4-dihydroxy-2-naphthoate octaprenyltransferase [Anaerolineae bacterium]|nr:1,4-dihydroxy-2-naphthoate octaprenyltransferase [Anaerolineae bacterium]
MNQTVARAGSLKAWYLAARPRSLTATYAPLFLAGAVAVTDGVFNLVRFALALIGALLLQIAANLINEYVDYNRGTDVHKVDGMGMVLSRTQLSPRAVLIGAVATVAGGVLIGLWLMATSGPLLLWIGLGGVLVVILYTAGPLPLAYIGLGEIAVFFFMGPLMTLGTYFAVSGRESTSALAAGLPIAFTVAAILHANNMRDLDADRQANKRTLAVRFGIQGARVEYAILIYGAYVAALALIALRIMPWTTLIVLFTLPSAIKLVRQASATDNPQILHRLQGITAQHHLRVGLLLAAGWLLYGVILSWGNFLSFTGK